jgi:sec-independent protein translocase protein TatA
MPANLRGWEILVIALLILLLFGAKRLPDAARGLGRSLRIFKAETKGLADDAGSSAAIEAIEQTEGSPAPDPAQRPEH